MRLSETERRAIKDCAAAVFGAGAEVRLFGSRVDDSLYGGDIDLYVEVDQSVSLTEEGRFKSLVQDRIGEQRIDLVVHVRGSEADAIKRLAARTGVAL